MKNVVVANGHLAIEGELCIPLRNYGGHFSLKPEEVKKEEFTEAEKKELDELPPFLRKMVEAGREHRNGQCDCNNLRGVVILHQAGKHLVKTNTDTEADELFGKISELLTNK